MIISTVILGYLSSNFKVEDMESKDVQESKQDGTLDVAKTPSKNKVFPSFIRDKLVYFRMGPTLVTYRRQLREAEDRIHVLTGQCKVFRQEAETSAFKEREMVQTHQAKLDEMAATHRTQMAALAERRATMETNMDRLLRDHIALSEAKKQLTKQLKAVELKLQLQENTRDALNAKLLLAEQKVNELQTKLEEADVEHAEQRAMFEAKFKQQEAMFRAKFREQEMKFDTKCAEQKAMFDNKTKEQAEIFGAKYKQQEEQHDGKYMAQKRMFDTKYKEQEAKFDTKCKEQQATFDTKYKEQAAVFSAKSEEQKAMFDTKLKEQEALFTARLQNERRKYEALQEQREAVIKRLKNTEAALLKSRQVKVTQEYEFSDAVNSLVPKEELANLQQQCILYRKMLSVMAALVLVLVAIVFVGFRFLFY